MESQKGYINALQGIKHETAIHIYWSVLIKKKNKTALTLEDYFCKC